MATQSSHVFMETALENLHWKFKENAKPDSFHEVTFAINQKNMEKLESLLYEVSDPTSPKYGQHWSREDLANLTMNKESSEILKHYLLENGAKITFESKYGEYISAEATIATWEVFFRTKFYEFSRDYTYLSRENSNKKFVDESLTTIRAKHFSLPQHLVNHVITVFDVVHLPVPSKINAKAHHDISKLEKNMRSQASPGYVSPQLINSQYGIDSNVGLSTASQGIYGTIGQYLSPTDLTLFQQNFKLPKRGITYSYGNHVADGQCGTNSEDCMEANLDVQYIMAVAWNIPTTYYYWDDSKDFMVGWMKTISSMDNLPQIFSISYGADEPLVSVSYSNQFNIEAAKLGIQGVTLIVASGDDGAQSSKASGQPYFCGYSPSFPATSPYVTAVGATMGPESGSQEVVCQAGGEVAITSGGGFSLRNSRPRYQDNAVKEYFQNVAGTSLAPVAGYNSNGRGLPDVSLLGHNYMIVVDKTSVFVDGTSASAPVFAGMVALLNSYRLTNNSSPMGWLNPALYATNGSFAWDITSGNNKCTSIYGGSYGSYLTTCCSEGYTATSGWDPVSGFGSIDFEEFIREYADISPYPIAPPPSSGNRSMGFSVYSTGVMVGIIAIAIVIAGSIFYCLAFLLNRYCFTKPAEQTSSRANRYQDTTVTAAVPVLTATPSSRGYYAQPPAREVLQIDYGDYFTDVRPTVVAAHTRL